MRELILATLVDCLLEHAPEELSVARIAERANISRGGVQYHFATRYDLLCAAIDYINNRRLIQFREDLAAVDPEDDIVDQVIDAHWRHLNERDFKAYQELVLIARSDPELADAFAARYRVFLQDWYESARTAIGWKYHDPEVARAGNIAHYILEGMSYGQLAGQLSPEIIADMLDYAKRVMRAALKG